MVTYGHDGHPLALDAARFYPYALDRMPKTIFNPAVHFYDETKFIWNRLKEESDIYFAAFEMYRDLFLERSVLKATKSVLPLIAKLPSDTEWRQSPEKIIRHFEDVCIKYKWKIRAQAYDAWRSEKRRRQREERYYAEVDEIAEKLKTVFMKLSDAIDRAGDDDVNLRTAISNLPKYADIITKMFEMDAKSAESLEKQPQKIDNSNLTDWENEEETE